MKSFVTKLIASMIEKDINIYEAIKIISSERNVSCEDLPNRLFSIKLLSGMKDDWAHGGYYSHILSLICIN